MSTRRQRDRDRERAERFVESLRAQVASEQEATDAIKGRIKVEYAKHVPDLDAERLRLGDYVPTGPNNHLAACLECRHEYWPCPTWHMLRRLYSPMVAAEGTRWTLQMVKSDADS